MTPEEEQYYQEAMQQCRLRKERQRLEMQRRDNFDPLSRPGKTLTASGISSNDSMVSSPLPPANQPNKPLVRGIVRQSGRALAPRHSQKHFDDDDDNDSDTEVDNEDDEYDNDTLAGMEAFAQQMLKEQAAAVTAPSTRRVASSSVSRPSGAIPKPLAPSEIARPTKGRLAARTAPIGQRGLPARRDKQTVTTFKTTPSSSHVKPTAPAEATLSVASGDNLEEDNEHGLDWDKLVKFEKYQKYVNNTVREQSSSAAAQRRRASVSATAAPSGLSGASASATASQLHPTPTTAAPPLQSTPTEAASTTLRFPADNSASVPPPQGQQRRAVSSVAAAPSAHQPATVSGLQPAAAPTVLPRQTAAPPAARAVPPVTRLASPTVRTVPAAVQAGQAPAHPTPHVEQAGRRPAALNKKSTMSMGSDDDIVGMEDFGKILTYFEKLDRLERKSTDARAGMSPAAELAALDSSGQAADDIDWDEFESLLLGRGWMSELLGEDAHASGQDDSDSEEDEDEQAPWLDAVTTLLLGLVDMSHRRYIGTDLLTRAASLPAAGHPAAPSPGAMAASGAPSGSPAARSGPVATAEPEAAATAAAEVAATGGGTRGSGSAVPGIAPPVSLNALDGVIKEDERAAAYWHAPFALLVQDDSKEACLEYANAEALRMLGCEYLDLFEMTSFQMVDPDPDQQQEWLWACNEAEASETKYATVPELQLVTAPAAGGAGTAQRLLARNVVIFRIDSLEGDFVGQAIVIRDWQMLPQQ